MKNLSDQKHPYYAVILAGGSGSRLWPLSRQQLPKQFLSLDGRENLLEATVSRLEPLISPDQVVVVTSEKHATGEAFDVLDKLSTILEPEGRNTAPAVAVAAAWLLDIVGSDAVMVVLPADHLIKDAQAFRNCLEIAGEEARRGSLLTFGIQPTRPDTGFGYIQVDQRDASVLDVIRFTEKPDLGTAELFLDEGGYFWNSGMFVWKASVILDEISKHLPDLNQVLESIRRQWASGEDWQEVLRQRFVEMTSVSIDYGVMERSDNVRLVPVDIDWSDVGSWDAVYDVSDKDADGNVIDGQVLALGCRNSLLRGNRRLLAASGLKDIIAVETDDAILLCRRGDSQSVRDVVDAVKARGGRE
ncbi:MAG: mannose-1-phosphate guanylyltransferase, partial [Mariprofundaceae bacterium]